MNPEITIKISMMPEGAIVSERQTSLAMGEAEIPALPPQEVFEEVSDVSEAAPSPPEELEGTSSLEIGEEHAPPPSEELEGITAMETGEVLSLSPEDIEAIAGAEIDEAIALPPEELEAITGMGVSEEALPPSFGRNRTNSQKGKW